MQVIDEFVRAVMGRWPRSVLQFEDFNMANAHPLLHRYRDHHMVFNDDIQVWSSSLCDLQHACHAKTLCPLATACWCTIADALSEATYWHHRNTTLAGE